MTRPTLHSLVHEVDEVRPQQDDAFNQCWDALWGENAVDVLLLEAPTGVGKSIIGLGLSRYAVSIGGTAYMVTPQRVLQDQLGVWEGNRVMKGRGSYDCSVNIGFSAAEGPCIRNAGIRETNPDCSDTTCPYFFSLNQAKKSRVVVHNYASLMAQARIGGHFDTRSLLVLDEGHTAVDWIRNYATVEVRRDDMATLTTAQPPDNPDDFMPWFRAVIGGLKTIPQGAPERVVKTIIRVMADQNVYGIPDVEEWDALQSEHNELMSEMEPEQRVPFFKWILSKLDDSAALVPWAVEFTESERDRASDTWKCIPLKVAPMANMLLGLGRKIVVMSATLLDARLTLLELGLSKKPHTFVQIDSAFPVSNRPVYVNPIGSMAFKQQSYTVPKMINEIVYIAQERHPDEPGIIHTVSHALAWKLLKGLREHPRMPGRRALVLLPRGGERDIIVQDFLAGKLGPNAILIGPGLTEGVDGKDGSLRWQVMAKAPWPHMKDPVVDHLLNNRSIEVRKWGEKWYVWKACQAFVQGCGRPVRTPIDHGDTYVLDASFSKILKSQFIPDYVRDAIINTK